MIEFLESIDRSLLLSINGWNSPFFDQLMWFISGKASWVPLYLILLFFIIKKERQYWWLAFIGLGLAITLADQISVKAFKEVFERYRPSHNLELKGLLHHVKGYLGGTYGFVSSHAANTFAIAGFLFLFYKNRTASIALLLWAALVSYSRVYLGVHYPSDVVCGGLLGLTAGVLMHALYNKVILKLKRNQ